MTYYSQFLAFVLPNRQRAPTTTATRDDAVRSSEFRRANRLTQRMRKANRALYVENRELKKQNSDLVKQIPIHEQSQSILDQHGGSTDLDVPVNTKSEVKTQNKSTITALERENTNLKKEQEFLSSKVIKKETEITNLTNTLTEKETEIANLKSAFAQREEQHTDNYKELVNCHDYNSCYDHYLKMRRQRNLMLREINEDQSESVTTFCLSDRPVSEYTLADMRYRTCQAIIPSNDSG